MSVVPVTSADLDGAEVSWFAALCSDDYRFLGVPEGDLRSSWAHCSAILREAEAQGFRNILCPSSYQVGQDTLSFVAGNAPITDKINMLAAVRCGEMQPVMLARTLATLDHMLEGRLTVNIISSDFPGEKADSAFRYQRSREVVEILKQVWTQGEIDYHGEVYQFDKVWGDPATPYQIGGPLLYFGGYSPAALELCGQHCDVYLMWPETIEALEGRMKAVHQVAEKYDRTLDYGLRVHMIVRDTEAEAKEYAEHLVSKLDDEYGRLIRDRAHDSGSLGVSHQARARELADEFGYVEPGLWTGIGRARSGCGAALVGSTDQVMSKIEAYQKMGIRAFIFSGYPHLDECRHVGARILPNIKTVSLPHAYGRVPTSTPATPLGVGERGMMERIKLTNELSMSRLVYGMWRLADDADTSPGHVQAKVEACLEQGITTIDQADIYGGYTSEAVFGAALKAAPALRDRIEIVTKCDIVAPAGRYADAPGKYYDTSAAHISASIEHSLRDMGIERIDLLLIHRQDPFMDHHETGAALDAAIASGKVGAVGVSNFMPWDWDLLQSAMSNPLVTNQIEISLAAHTPFVDGQIAHLQRLGVTPMAWSPLAGGALLGRGNDALNAALKQMAEENGVDTAAVAVAWLLAHPAKILPVMGTNSLDRIARISDALKVTMDRPRWFALYTAALGHEVP